MKRLILEVSLKPFHDSSPAATAEVIRGLLRQWDRLIRSAEKISFLLWTAEGSEILEYKRRMEDEIQWAKWIGIANDSPAHSWDPERRTLHSHRWLYRDDASTWTYARLRDLVASLKTVGQEVTGLPVTVGTIFDPGPEFAESSFKYQRHPEINKGDIMGACQWVHCAAVLRGDTESYAGFPQGIPDGTTLGTFLGRQSQHFFHDLGIDYLWLSNGFGYSLDSWNVTGEVFDGNRFDLANVEGVNASILRFWEDFRRECPAVPIETRGSNLSTGMDLASDAAPVREIFRGGYGVTAPVNSPWAALNGDYGLEIVGWLSHIAELPEGSAVPFRYYIHDPWWLNSPWLDRYGREPHDIYLPLACSRLEADGTPRQPDSVALLTIDDSYGRMPDEVPSEITPHLLRALQDFPDQPGLVTWVYPFDEYHDWTLGNPTRISEVFFGDWFIRGAVNSGFPLNTVVSTRNLVSAGIAPFADTILVSPAPPQDSAWADSLVQHVESGGRLLLYGPLDHLDTRLAKWLDVNLAPGIAGEVNFTTTLRPDAGVPMPGKMLVRELTSGGGVGVALPARGDVEVLATVESGGEARSFALARRLPGGGTVAWVRGAFCADVQAITARLPEADNPAEWFPAERLMRWVLQVFGYEISYEKPVSGLTDPLLLAARRDNGWFFSGYWPSTSVRLGWRFPEGVPIPVGCDVLVTGNGPGQMHLPKAWHRECRVFVTQPESGEVSCREQYSGEIGISRRLLVTGLKDARVTFLPQSGTTPVFTLNDAYLGLGTPVPSEKSGTDIIAHHVTGDLLISW